MVSWYWMECARTACLVHDHNLVLMKECQKTCFSMCHIFILYIITIPVLASSRMEVLKLFSKVWVLMQRHNREREREKKIVYFLWCGCCSSWKRKQNDGGRVWGMGRKGELNLGSTEIWTCHCWPESLECYICVNTNLPEKWGCFCRVTCLLQYIFSIIVLINERGATYHTKSTKDL